MPTYTYKCKKCDEKFEVNQRIFEDSFEIHSEACAEIDCDGKLTKIFHVPCLRFLGSGFYVNDYKKEAKEPSISNSSEPIKKPQEVIKT
ncbi:MAG TPA: FmdB family zinc ribbon protein [Candidatus Paceibacterota bacterium]|nr:FmdB family zinc ribbon protein [Candidatus Paceibacterota bacterium]